jgi:hypothetical protein
MNQAPRCVVLMKKNGGEKSHATVPLRPSALFTALYPSKTLYPLYSPLSPLRPSVTPTAFCLLHGPLSPLWPSAPSKALCPTITTLYLTTALYPLNSRPLSPLRPSVTSTAFFLLHGPLSPSRPFSPLRHSFHSAALCPLYGPQSFLRPSVPSMDFYPLYGPQSTIQQSASSTALCPLYGSLPLSGALPLLLPSVSSTARRLLYGLLSPLREMFFLSASMMFFRCFLDTFRLDRPFRETAKQTKRAISFGEIAKCVSRNQFVKNPRGDGSSGLWVYLSREIIFFW